MAATVNLTRRTALSTGAALMIGGSSLLPARAGGPRVQLKVIRPAGMVVPHTDALSASSYRRDLTIHPLANSLLGERGSVVPVHALRAGFVRGSDGVVRYKTPDGKLYLHPVGTCHYVMDQLVSYNQDKNPVRLTDCMVQAQALAGSLTRVNGAAFLPYRFEWSYYGEDLGLPWYSGMAQGEAVHMYTWLGEVTGKKEYLDLADILFNAFLTPYVVDSIPWVAGVDNNGMLWLDEYPRKGGVLSKVFNGHIIAGTDLMRYWQHLLVRDPERAALVKPLVEGCFTTAKFYRNACRLPGTASSYVVSSVQPNPHYHPLHIGLLATIYNATGDLECAQTMDAMITDFPYTQAGGNVVIGAGTHTLRKFDASGNVTATRTFTTARATGAPASQRTAWLQGFASNGTWLLISAGSLAGWYIPETPGSVYYRSLNTDMQTWVTPRPVQFREGSTVTALAFDATAAITGSRRITFRQPSRASSDMRACIQGRQMIHMSNGSFAGMWVPEGADCWYFAG